MITKQNNGFRFIGLISLKETTINRYHSLAGSYAIIELRGKYLLCYNTMRRQWELPAGKREDGETPLECAKRELHEETGQFITDLQFIGLARIKNILNGAEKVQSHILLIGGFPAAFPRKPRNFGNKIMECKRSSSHRPG
jgi:8-oxo-dGTP diphosphatase